MSLRGDHGGIAAAVEVAAPTDERPTVAYRGMPVRRGPLSWGQRWAWDIIRELVPDEQRINLGLMVRVGPGRSVADVVTVLTSLLARFETLRTAFHVNADGEPEQVVHGDGAIPVEVREAAAQPPQEVAEALKDALVSRRYDLSTGPLVGFGIVTAGGRPGHVVLGLSNLVVDGWSLELLRHELRHRLASATGPAAGDVGAEWQPLDQAQYERTGDAQAVARTGYEYWREQLSAIRALPPPRWRPAGETPRYWCARFTSAALGPAARAVAAEALVPPSAVLLAGLAAVVGLRTGQPALGLLLTSNNRYEPRRRQSVGRFVQGAPVRLDLDVPTFAELVSQTARRMLHAARYGRWDPREVGRLVHGEGPHRGVHLALPVIFDFHSQLGAPGPPDRVVAGDLPGLAVGSQLRWSDAVEQENMHLFTQVQRLDAQSWLVMWIDTRYLSRADLAAVAFGLERLLIVAAAGEVRLSDLVAVTGLAPGCRAE